MDVFAERTEDGGARFFTRDRPLCVRATAPAAMVKTARALCDLVASTELQRAALSTHDDVLDVLRNACDTMTAERCAPEVAVRDAFFAALRATSGHESVTRFVNFVFSVGLKKPYEELTNAYTGVVSLPAGARRAFKRRGETQTSGVRA